MSPTPSTRTCILLMLGSVVLFAANTLLVRGIHLAYPAADGWVASLFRGIVGLLIVGAFFHGRGLRISHLFTRPLLALRGIFGGFGILAFYITVTHLGASRAVVLNLTYPIFGSLFAALWLHEHLPFRAWLWMAAGFGGLLLFLAPDLSQGFNPYDILGIVGAIAAGIVVVLIRQLRHSEHTATIYASQCFAGALFAAWPAAGPSLALPGNIVILMTLSAVLVAIAQLAMTHAYRTLPVARGSSIQMLVPIATAAGGFLLLGERFTMLEMLGAGLTLLATWQVVVTKPSQASLRLASVPKVP